MDSREAREILKLYRPGDNDSADPRMAEALEQAKRDPELAAWFAQHRAVCAVIRSRLKGIPIPAGLKRKIIVERMDHAKVIPLPGAAKILAAAAAIVILSLIGWSVFNRAPDERTFLNYRDRMAKSVQRGIPYMDFVSTNQADIREYFHTNRAPVDYALSKSLAQLPGEGGSVIAWYDQNVEMLCLNAGSSAPGQTNDLWVFIANKTALPDAPAPGAAPQFLKVGNLMTMSWTKDGKVYLLAARGEQEDLQKYLE
jgi:hypothetical protein